MNLFSFFRKKIIEEQKEDNILKLQGPRYLRNYLTEVSDDLKKQVKISHPNIQWSGQLVSSSGNSIFEIKYFGDLLEKITIVSTKDMIPQYLIAVDSTTKEEILLFDKSQHGWEGFIANAYEKYKSVDRSNYNIYSNKKGLTHFRIVVFCYYNESTKDYILEDRINENEIKLESKSVLNIQDAFDDSFDYLVIYAFDSNNKRYEIINEELA